MSYLRSIYDNLQQDLGETTKKFWNTEVKKMLKFLYKDNVMCPEYDLASQLHMSYKVIKSCVSGWGIPKYVAIKAIAQMLHHLLHVNEIKVKWSPKHQLIVTTNNDRDIDNVNLVSWIIYPKERVKLSYWKVEKASWVT